MNFNVGTKIQGALLTHPEKTIPVFEKFFKAALTESTLMLQAETVRRTPVSSGFLRRSVGSEVRGIGLNMMGVVGTPLQYALPVEQGAAPHFPPVGPIALWVSKHNFSGLMWANQITGVESTLQQLAYLVARKISIIGLKPTWMFRDALEAAASRIKKNLQTAAQNVVGELGL